MEESSEYNYIFTGGESRGNNTPADDKVLMSVWFWPCFTLETVQVHKADISRHLEMVPF